MVLKKENFGYSMPATAPAYAEFPDEGLLIRNAQKVGVLYEADDDAVSDVLPEPLEPLHSPPRILAWIGHWPISGLGPYNEMMINIYVKFQRRPATYCPYIYHDNDIAMCAARELWGWPSKLAKITMCWRQEQAVGIMERPEGKRLTTLTVFPERTVKEQFFATPPPFLNLRIIPNPEKRGKPTIQLIRVYISYQSGENFEGRASLSFDSPSEIDPVYRLGPIKILKGYYAITSTNLPLGKVVKEY